MAPRSQCVAPRSDKYLDFVYKIEVKQEPNRAGSLNFSPA